MYILVKNGASLNRHMPNGMPRPRLVSWIWLTWPMKSIGSQPEPSDFYTRKLSCTMVAFYALFRHSHWLPALNIDVENLA